MAVPVTTPRVAPVGVRLSDGFSTKIAFAQDDDVSFWELTVQPLGLSGGDAIEITTMHNVTYRTMAPRSLITATPITLTVAYDPFVYDQIIALLNVDGDITITFPDTDTLDFFGYLQEFTPSENEEGTMPQASITIQPTNFDPADGSEQGPVLTATTGT